MQIVARGEFQPSAVARELLRNFPKSGGKRRRRRPRASQAQNGENGRDQGETAGGAEVDGGNVASEDRVSD